jgi:lipopolysaccharide assembly protein A
VWKTPLIILVLIAFTAGVVIGVLGMVPRWWRHRRTARKLTIHGLGGQQSTINPDSTQM